ncbi:MAG TPA: HAD family phosphatase [Polyangiaceae bacterium]|nr:HAD family phosphatase [Polyangiaceae bacterium]
MSKFVLHLPPQRYEAFIFDCDGTLVDSMPLHFAAWREAFGQFQAPFEFTWQLFQSRAGMGLEQTVRELNLQFATRLDPLAVVQAQVDASERLLATVQAIDPVARFAREVAAASPVSVASGGKRHHVARSLSVTGLDVLFPVVVTQEDVTRGKPDPEMFLLAAERMGVGPAQCLVIEDSPLGLEAAKAAGMGAAWVEHRQSGD